MNSGRSLKNKHCDGPQDQECGDWWTYIAIKSNPKLIFIHFVGKRTEITCNYFLNRVFGKLPLSIPDTPIVVATDGNPQYREELTKLYCEPCTAYGQVIKQRKENHLNAVIRKAIWGKPAKKTISTSVIEGYNNKTRFVRESVDSEEKLHRSPRKSWHMSVH